MGGLAGGALLLGAVIGYRIPLSRKIVAGVMAFGSGVLISALSFELMQEAYHQTGLMPVTVGFIAGALVYSIANRVLSLYGAKHRKRSTQQTQKDTSEASGAAIALGALLDGIPESMAIGLTMLAGGGVSLVTVIAIFISNIPEGLSSSAGMKASGRSALFIFWLWSSITLASAIAAVIGATLMAHVSVSVQAAVTALAAGAILSMLSETMMPEAYEGTHDWAGIITCAGFLCAFLLTMCEG